MSDIQTVINVGQNLAKSIDAATNQNAASKSLNHGLGGFIR